MTLYEKNKTQLFFNIIVPEGKKIPGSWVA